MLTFALLLACVKPAPPAMSPDAIVTYATEDGWEMELRHYPGPDGAPVETLRYEALRRPLGMPPGSEIYEAEESSYHLVALDGERPWRAGAALAAVLVRGLPAPVAAVVAALGALGRRGAGVGVAGATARHPVHAGRGHRQDDPDGGAPPRHGSSRVRATARQLTPSHAQLRTALPPNSST